MSRAGTRWRLLRHPPADGARNMALDHAVAEVLEGSSGVLRLYRWSRPTVSFGRNEPAGRFRERGATPRDVLDHVRRPTGGRAVLHDDELTYAIALPLRSLGGVRSAYRRINEGLVAGLNALGVPARMADEGEGGVSPVSAGPCFDLPAPGEVVVAGRKLVGSAQARIGGALLQHGSLLLGGSQDALSSGSAEGRTPAVRLDDVLPERPPLACIEEALAAGLERVLGGTWRADASTPAEIEVAGKLEERYRDPCWTWRR